MFKNYFNIAWRLLLRQKGFTFINISGLAVGLACCILIMLWVQDELSYDKFHDSADDIYYVILNQEYNDGQKVITQCTPGPLAGVMKEEFPEIIRSSRYTPFLEKLVVNRGEIFHQERIRLVDQDFLSMFSFKLIEGSPGLCLADRKSIVLTQEMATKFFGDEDPIGKTLTINESFDFTVTGIMEDPPDQSSLKFSALARFEFMTDLGRDIDVWGSNSYFTFVQLQPGTQETTLEEKIKDFHKKYHEGNVTLTLFPLTSDRLYYPDGSEGNIKYVRIFSLVAIFVLLIASINFMNLSTARSEKRAREVGIRKAIGANRSNLIRQFINESLLTAFIAFIIAIGIVELILPVFNNLAGKQMSLSLFANPINLAIVIAFVLLTGLIAGSYPAFVLSSFRPVKALAHSKNAGKTTSIVRRCLVIIQFSISIILIICTISVVRQLRYMENSDLGLNKENVLRLPFKGFEGSKYSVFKNEILQNPEVQYVTAAASWPGYIGSNTAGWDWEGKDPEKDALIGYSLVDFDYDKVLELQMAEGRFYDQQYSTDSTSSIVMNEEAIRYMGLENPTGKVVHIWGLDLTIIGVVKDFHYQSLATKIKPLGIFFLPDWNKHIFIKLSGNNTTSALSSIETAYHHINPGYPFESMYLDEVYDGMYDNESRMSQLLGYFSILAIFISCLGLFGLTAHTVERKTKEIGIRKVLGASVNGIVGLLTREFTQLVLIAILIAIPIAWYFMNQWLDGYAYRINIGWWVFAIAAATALIISILTTSMQAIRAAITNPVKTLRYE